MNEIKIDKIKFKANHGVFEFEKENGQYFYLSINIKTNFEETLFDDNLNNTIHYGYISEDAIKFLQENTFDLIETAIYRLSNFLLSKYNQIDELELEIFKPNAPVELDFKNISVKIKHKKTKVYISLGSSIGDLNKYFDDAIKMLKKTSGIYCLKESQRYSSLPLGGVAKEEFLNSVVEIETILTPAKLLKILNNIERKLERKREIKWDDRTIDLDILFYGNQIISKENLIIPHPEIENRDFVLKPLLDLNKNLRNPVNNKRILDTYNELENSFIKE